MLTGPSFANSLRWPALSLVIALALLLPGCGSSSHPMPSQQAPAPLPPVPLIKLSTDTFTNTTSQHATEVEPGAFAFGSTIVTAFQVGRIFGGGGADIGFATSTDGGATWKNGFLPGITLFQGGGAFTAVSDPAVAYDATNARWLIASLPLGRTQAPQNIVAVSSSQDGITWSSNIVQVSHTADADKNWITCDNSSKSPNVGNCYVEWDDPGNSDLIWMSKSSDGGQTWQNPGRNTLDKATGLGGIPVVQPNNGNVIVPIEQVCNACAPSMLAYSSTDGGNTWSATVKISPITDHLVAGDLRTEPLPSANIDAAGTVYVVWQDCRFRANCTSNDLVLSTSSDGTTWTPPARIPIDAITSTVDHFIPGLGIDPATSGSTAHLGLTYYFYPVANCGASPLPACQLEAGFIASQDGGATWSAPTTLTIPMSLSSLPNTFAGLMVGDYISTVFAGGKARPIFALANPPSTGNVFDEAIYTTTNAFAGAEARRFSSAGERSVPGAHSDHGPRKFYDLERRHRVVLPPK